MSNAVLAVSHEHRSAEPAAGRTKAGPRRRRLLLAIGFIAAVVVWDGSRRAPCQPSSGAGLLGRSAHIPAGGRFRVGIFNMHSGEGRDGRLDLTRTAACLARLDLIGLNEVRGAWIGRPVDQAEELARSLEMSWVFAPAERRWWHEHFGNAALSSLSVRRWQRLPLPSEHGQSCRNMLLLRIEHGGQVIHVLITHLDRTDDDKRQEQLRFAAGLFMSLAEPAVLIGDLNTTADDSELAKILAAPGVGDPVGEILGKRDERRIDWILTRGLKTIDAGVLDIGASDHPLVWAELAPDRQEIDAPRKPVNGSPRE